MNTPSVECLIFEEHNDFTISIVTREFAVRKGCAFFKKYENLPNFISTKDERKNLLKSIMSTIGKNIPAIRSLIQLCFGDSSQITADMPEIINSLFKLFSAHEHQAVGPEVLDPIIIQEDNFSKQDIAEVINLHRASILRPRIVIILKDNDIRRASKLLRFCHHGLRVRIIENSGLTENAVVINTGTDDVQQFLDIYARQCFDACSRTKTNIIVNKEWAEGSSVREYAPSLLQFRTNVINDNKMGIIGDVSSFIEELSRREGNSDIELGFKCLAHLFRVYCLDFGGEDIVKAEKLAEELNNGILQAHVYRYAHFIPNTNRQQQNELLEKAQKIFKRENMADHSTYCENNRLVNAFYEERIVQAQFENMLAKARSDVPGLVGMSTIWNNVGVSFLYNSKNSEAIECFEKGLAHQPDNTKRLGLMCNLLTARHRAGGKISEAEITSAIEYSMLHFGPGPHAFLGANNLINILKVCDKNLARDMVERHPVKEVISQGLESNLGSSSLTSQVKSNIPLLEKAGIPIENLKKASSAPSAGIRNRFIEVTGFNPAIYNVWF